MDGNGLRWSTPWPTRFHFECCSSKVNEAEGRALPFLVAGKVKKVGVDPKWLRSSWAWKT